MLDERFVFALLPINTELYTDANEMWLDAIHADDCAAEALTFDFS